MRKRGRPLVLRCVSMAAIGLAVCLIAAPADSLAGTAGSIRLAGRVFGRATIWLSQLTLSFSSVGTLSSAGSLTRKIVGIGQIWLTDLRISGNGSKFTVSVQSVSAEQSGEPSLVDQDTGEAIPYRLTYGGADLNFSGSEAWLAGVDKATAVGEAPQPLALALPRGTDVTGGRFADHLVVVVRAR